MKLVRIFNRTAHITWHQAPARDGSGRLHQRELPSDFGFLIEYSIREQSPSRVIFTSLGYDM
jgi:hypothetical protein